MPLSIVREDCPVALLCPRYCATAARAGRPAYQARSAASCEALGKSLLLALATFTMPTFMVVSLVDQTCYCDKKSYHNRSYPWTAGAPPIADRLQSFEVGCRKMKLQHEPSPTRDA